MTLAILWLLLCAGLQQGATIQVAQERKNLSTVTKHFHNLCARFICHKFEIVTTSAWDQNEEKHVFLLTVIYMMCLEM